jgi:hypothetical protein
MIVCEFQGKLLLVRQTDHMALSGQLAAAWGNDRFARPVPFGPLVVAAAEHDTGWTRWEDAPTVDPSTKRPYQFYDLPVELHLTLYREGVDAVAAKDAHAGLLVNLHCQGLYNQRFGLTPELTMRRLAPEQEATVRRSLAALQAQHRDLGRRVRIDEPTLWAQYELLQVYDVLSLYLCMLPLRETTLGPVPLGVGGEMMSLALRPVGEGDVIVSPWPFRERSLTVSVPARLVPQREYASDDDFRQALAAAEGLTLNFVLQPG